MSNQIPPRSVPDTLLGALDRLAIGNHVPVRLASEILAPLPKPVPAWDRPWWVRD